MLELFHKAGVVAWPLGLFSVLALGIILERLFTLARLRRIEEHAFGVLQAAFNRRDEEALRDPKIAAAPVARIIEAIQPLRGADDDALQQAADVALATQRLRLRRYTGTLATIGSTAPFIGLFGTVLGVMAAFQEMAQRQLTGEKMSAGISEALSATALGLLVAIPSVMAYNYFVGRVQAHFLQIQGHVAHLAPMMRREEV